MMALTVAVFLSGCGNAAGTVSADPTASEQTAGTGGARGSDGDGAEVAPPPVFSLPVGAPYVPAESVYAVFEIRQELSKGNVEYAADKAASVRHLHRSSAPIRQLSQAAAAKEPPRILAGILATRNGWAGFGSPLVSSLSSLTDDGRLDLGCVLDSGAFEVPEGSPAPGMESAPKDVGLAMFVMRLIARLNAMGTVPALDVRAYTAPLVHPVGQER